MSYAAATGEERYALYATATRLEQALNANENFAGTGVRNDAYDVEALIDELEAAIADVNAAT